MNEIALIDQDWYQTMIEDIKQHTLIKIVEAKHYLGKRVSEKKEETESTWGDYFIEQVAEDLKIQRRELEKCIQFYKKYPQLRDNITQLSWYFITHKLLPTPKKRKFMPPPLPEKKYGLIYADPPWEYDTAQSTKPVDKHYPVLNKQELCWFGDKVKEITDDNCTLLMWTTTGRLNWAFPVMEAWGFKYKTSMVWDKVKYNMGYYFSARHEILLIGGQGISVPDRQDLVSSIDSVQVIEKTKHSKKPEAIRAIIESLWPDRKKIELFCPIEKEIEGWDRWGIEI